MVNEEMASVAQILWKQLEFRFGSKPNEAKTKLLRINRNTIELIKLYVNNFEDVESFVYLCSTVSAIEKKNNEDVKMGIDKARGLFTILQNAWNLTLRSRNQNWGYLTPTKYLPFYMIPTHSNTRNIQSFANHRLRRIMNITQGDKITNEALWRLTNEDPIDVQIRRRK